MEEIKKETVNENTKSPSRDIVELEGLTPSVMSQIQTINIPTSNAENIYHMLLKKFDRKEIIRGQISRVSTVDQKEDGTYYFTVTVRIDNELDCIVEDLEFTIPGSISFQKYASGTPKQQCEIRMTHAVKMTGAWIPVQIISITRKAIGYDTAGNDIYDYKIRGSRVKGMQILQDKWFKGENMLREGDITDAYILFSTESYVVCEILGVQTTISFRECCAEPIRNCKTKFHSGDMLRVKIGRVNVQEDGVRVIASGRLYEIENRKKTEFDQIRVKGIYFGYVSHMSRKGHYIVQLAGFKGITADINPNKVTGRIKLNRGDMVSVVCTHKVEDGMFIIGTAEKK